jgi:hypothetical protein
MIVQSLENEYGSHMKNQTLNYQQDAAHSHLIKVLDYTLLPVWATEGETGLGNRSFGDSLSEPRKLQYTERCAPLHLKQTCWKSHPEQ